MKKKDSLWVNKLYLCQQEQRVPALNSLDDSVRWIDGETFESADSDVPTLIQMMGYSEQEYVHLYIRMLQEINRFRNNVCVSKIV